jgi:hypothetical protein
VGPPCNLKFEPVLVGSSFLREPCRPGYDTKLFLGFVFFWARLSRAGLSPVLHIFKSRIFSFDTFFQIQELSALLNWS